MFIARAFCEIWSCAPAKIVIDTSVQPRNKITRIDVDLCFCIGFTKNVINFILAIATILTASAEALKHEIRFTHYNELIACGIEIRRDATTNPARFCLCC